MVGKKYPPKFYFMGRHSIPALCFQLWPISEPGEPPRSSSLSFHPRGNNRDALDQTLKLRPFFLTVTATTEGMMSYNGPSTKVLEGQFL